MEVASLVLGAFPLLVGALEKNGEALEMVGDWWNVKRLYEKTLKSVKAEHKLFERNLKDFLEPVFGDESELNALVTDPFHEQWNSVNFATSLKDQLPTAYESYVDKMQEFYEIMVALGKLLGVNKTAFQRRFIVGNANGKASLQGRTDIRGVLESEWHRIKFGVSKKRRAGLLSELAACNHYLWRFSASSDVPDSSLRLASERKARIPLSLLNFWQHAKDLYTLMQQAWSCSCCTSHSTDLLLRNYKDPHKIEFKVLFTFAEKLTCQHAGAWDWREASITALSNHTTHPRDPHNKAILQAVSGNVEAASPASQPSSGFNKGRKPKGVRFLDQNVPGANVTALLPLHAKTSSPEITDLCANLTKTTPDNAELGVLTGKLTQFLIFLPEQKTYLKTMLEHVTLHDVLRSPRQRSLNRRQRYSIALGIASAYMQLHDSPWVWTGLDKHDIYLLWDLDAGRFYEQPRISRNIPSQVPKVRTLLDNSTVRLGILLLELAFNEVLEENPFRQNRPTLNSQPDLGVDKVAAEEWCLCCARDEAPHFEKPVLWCLRPRTRVDSTGDTWRRDFFNNVVQPLAACCKENNFDIQGA